MKVKELIEMLSDEPQDAEVSINLQRPMPNWLLPIEEVISWSAQDISDYTVELCSHLDTDNYDETSEMSINLDFSKTWLNYIKEKFDIEHATDLADAVWQMIETYMELDGGEQQ